MKILLLISLLFVGIVLAGDGASDVVILTDSTFDAQTASGEWLLEFYAPWCGHCKNLAPKYEELATQVKGKYNIAKIDCTVEKGLGQRFGIRGYPTIKFLKEGQVYDYAGPRTVDAFVGFLDGGYSSATVNSLPKAAAPQPPANAANNNNNNNNKGSDVIVLTDANFGKTDQGTWFLEFYAPWCGHCKRLAPIYEEVATSLKGKVHVGKVNCEEEKVICSQYGIQGYPTVYFKKGGELRDYNGPRSADAFKKFAEKDWESVDPQPIPEPISGWKLYALEILSALEDGVGGNLWVIIGLCVIVGIVLGVIVVVCCSSNPPSKTIHYTATTDNTSNVNQPIVEEVSNKDD